MVVPRKDALNWRAIPWDRSYTHNSTGKVASGSGEAEAIRSVWKFLLLLVVGVGVGVGAEILAGERMRTGKKKKGEDDASAALPTTDQWRHYVTLYPPAGPT